jgi:hypothetical protein
MGRDLILKPPQHGEAVNFLIYPHVGVDGKTLPRELLENQFEYANLGGQD